MHRSLACLLVFCSACAAGRTPIASHTANPAPAADIPAPASDPYTDLLIPVEACKRPAARVVTRAQAHGDLRVLERLVRSAYAGFDARRDVEWDMVFERTRAEVGNLADPVPVPAFAALVSKHLSAAGDAHFNVSLPGAEFAATDYHEDAYTAELVLKREGSKWVVREAKDASLQGASLLACEGFTLREVVRPSVLGPPLEMVGLLVRLSRSEPEPLNCRFAAARPGGAAQTTRLSLRRLRETKRPPVEDFRNLPAAEVRDGTIPYVRVRKMWGNAADVLRATAPRVREGSAVIVDLRGNPGGGDDGAIAWYGGLSADAPLSHAGDELTSEVTLQGELNRYTCDVAARAPGDPHRGDAERGRDKARAALEEKRRAYGGRPFKQWEREPAERFAGKAPTAYNGSLVFLADSACASSCETMLFLGRQLENTVVLGVNTAGAQAYANGLSYRLPATGAIVQLQRAWFHDEDPAYSVKESRGYEPDLWLDTESPEPIAGEVARCLSREPCRERLRGHVRR